VGSKYWPLGASRTSLASDAAALLLITMAKLTVGNVPIQVVVSLRRRAAERNRSADAEHRDILRRARLGETSGSLKAMLAEMPDVGAEEFARPRARRRRVDL
jgi:plasmid stability protein